MLKQPANIETPAVRINPDNELWVHMKGLDAYRVSNYGRIKKIIGKNEEKIIEQIVSKKDGTPRFLINRTWYDVPIEIAKSFRVPNMLKHDCVGHVNGIRTDNRPENLYYCEMNSDDLISPYVLCDWRKINGMSASRTPLVKVTSIGNIRLAAYASINDAEKASGISHNKLYKYMTDGAVIDNSYKWIPFASYFKLPEFRLLAKYITENQKKNHPWLL